MRQTSLETFGDFLSKLNFALKSHFFLWAIVLRGGHSQSSASISLYPLCPPVSHQLTVFSVTTSINFLSAALALYLDL